MNEVKLKTVIHLDEADIAKLLDEALFDRYGRRYVTLLQIKKTTSGEVAVIHAEATEIEGSRDKWDWGVWLDRDGEHGTPRWFEGRGGDPRPFSKYYAHAMADTLNHDGTSGVCEARPLAEDLSPKSR